MFEPEVTVRNSIPTVNRNLSSPDAVLGNAPPAEQSPFTSIAMKTADRILSHMDDSYLAYAGNIELMLHELHMQEMWHTVKVDYDALKNTLPANDTWEFCQCAKNVNGNGVMKYLRLFAAVVYRNKGFMWLKSQGHANKWGCGTNDVCKVMFTTGMFKPTSGQQWSDFRKDLLSDRDPSAVRDMSLFLYCMLEI